MTGVEAIALNKIADIIQEVKSNRLTAGVIEDTVAKGYAEANPDLEFNVIPNTEESGSAIAFPKGSKLAPEFNRVLQQMQANGKLKELATQWFSRSITQAPNPESPQSPSPQTGAKDIQPAAPKFSLDFGKILPSLPFILGCDESFSKNGNYNGNCHSRNGICARSCSSDIISGWGKGS
ncbi:hypothetical protein BCD67_21555 [Oscillatoriales cyanobacterium USR001]|nr:hypothetical protein BCD67_21555 [Oscillatoriales cyanobacterium USR001]